MRVALHSRSLSLSHLTVTAPSRKEPKGAKTAPSPTKMGYVGRGDPSPTNEFVLVEIDVLDDPHKAKNRAKCKSRFAFCAVI